MELILKYFNDLDETKNKQLSALGGLYEEWNSKINLISRQDIAHLYEHHVLHSLALAKYDPFQANMYVLDVGTGGGFPGIPLAIMFPEVHFTLLDSTLKKINAVRAVAASLKLSNIDAVHSRVEDHQGIYDLILCRAVSTMSQIIAWSMHLAKERRWIMLKGGNILDMRKELPPLYKITFIPVSDYFNESYFKEKFIVDVIKPG